MMARYIRGNKSCRVPGSYIFLDTETNGIPLDIDGRSRLETFRLGCAIYYRLRDGKPTARDVLEFTDLSTFWLWVRSRLSKKRATWLWAHNLAFDLTVTRFWDLVDDGEYSLVKCVTQDPPTIIRAKSEHGILTCVDTLNWWRSPLADMGASVGIEKMPMPGRSEPDEVWMEYCRNDAEIIEEAVSQLTSLVTEHDFGVLQQTAPSQAFSLYRHRLGPKCYYLGGDTVSGSVNMPNEQTILLPLPHSNVEALKLESAAYYGCQPECLFLGAVYDNANFMGSSDPNSGLDPDIREIGPVYVLDINSAYPYVMADKLYPSSLIDVVDCPSIEDLRRAMRRHAVIASVQINTDEIVFPVRVGTQVTRRLGSYWTTLCGPELTVAMACDCVGMVSKMARYHDNRMFVGYVSELWALKDQYTKSGNAPWAGMIKLLLNGLYGKFGQHRHKWESDAGESCPRPWSRWVGVNAETGLTQQYRSIGELTEKANRDGYADHACVFVAAYVTSYMRVLMDKVVSCAGKGNVYYTCVDAIHVNTDGYDNLVKHRLVADNCMGKLQVKGVYKSARYLGLNHYWLEDKEIVSGVSRHAKKIAENAWEQQSFQRLDSIVAGKPKPGVIVTTEVVTRPERYEHGRVGKDGWVLPFRDERSVDQ